MVDVGFGEMGLKASPRRVELLDLAYGHVLEHGLSDLSLRPLASAIGSSPRVLLYLFGSKTGLVSAILARAREHELSAIGSIRSEQAAPELATGARRIWSWLSAPEHRNVLSLWVEAYGLSLVEPEGPWSDFASTTVKDWLDLLGSQQTPQRRLSRDGLAERTAVLALLRGAMLDLLATNDCERTTRAVESWLQAVMGSGLESVKRPKNELQRDRPKKAAE